MGEELAAKRVDFGLSKFFQGDAHTHVSREMVVGTPRYVDLEYALVITFFLIHHLHMMFKKSHYLRDILLEKLERYYIKLTRLTSVKIGKIEKSKYSKIENLYSYHGKTSLVT